MSEYVLKHRKGAFPCYTMTLVTAYASEHFVYTVVYTFLHTSLHFDSQGYPISVCDHQTHKAMDKKKLTDINLPLTKSVTVVILAALISFQHSCSSLPSLVRHDDAVLAPLLSSAHH